MDDVIVQMLACPKTRQPLRKDGDWLICDAAQLKYPIEDGLPILLPDRAVAISSDSKEVSADDRTTS